MTTTATNMQHARLGNTGLRVSRIFLGCMSFGDPSWDAWVKGEEESIDYIKHAYNLGINFYSISEIILVKALKHINAPEVALFVRVGLSRKYILDACAASVKRLGVDYIDLHQIHRLDPFTPMDEIMEALNDLVRSGKIRYIGASSMAAWQFQKLNATAERHNWAKFVSMQNLYNLTCREEEREMLPYCLDTGIGMIPWSPLAAGQLTDKKRSNTTHSNSTINMKMFPSTQQESNEIIINRLEELAKKIWCYLRSNCSCLGIH